MSDEKRKMQDVSFRSVGELLDYLPPDELTIVERLRELVFECIPDITEKLSFNVPFYRQHANICFIWPGSVPWGKVRVAGVQFGFTSGYLLTDEAGYLEQEGRKQVFCKRFFNPRDINRDVLSSLLFEAALLDEENFLAKKRRPRP